jgi:murein DD-endopeptidase MepM/ murein hydrolase activator NlpD
MTVMYIVPIKAADVLVSSQMARSTGAYHQGIDLVCPDTADPTIIAAAAGVVAQVGLDIDPPGYGNFAIVRHPNDEYTLYGHMKKVPVVAAGAAVEQGEEIGTMGSTGDSSGVHLHFEIVLPPDRAKFWSAEPRWQYKKNPFLEVEAFRAAKYGGESAQVEQRKRWILAASRKANLPPAQVIAKMIESGVLPPGFSLVA